MTQSVSTSNKALIAVLSLPLLLVLFYVFFDIPNRFFYEERGWDVPTNPVEKAAYDYAHSLKLPESVPEPVPFNFPLARFRALIPWLPDVSTQYFEHLCKTESGEYVFNTASDVEGIFQMRPRGKIGDTGIDYNRYALEEPTGIGWSSDEGTDDDVFVNYIQPMSGKYLFVERPNLNDSHSIVRGVREVNPNPPAGRRNGYSTGVLTKNSKTFISFRLPWMITYKEASQRQARYGYTWRGIKRDYDRRYAIGAGEVLIVDLNTNEVLAVKRRFKQSGYNRSRGSRIWWGNARTCENEMIRKKGSTSSPTPIDIFIYDVLKPIPGINKPYIPEAYLDIYLGY